MKNLVVFGILGLSISTHLANACEIETSIGSVFEVRQDAVYGELVTIRRNRSLSWKRMPLFQSYAQNSSQDKDGVVGTDAPARKACLGLKKDNREIDLPTSAEFKDLLAQFEQDYDKNLSQKVLTNLGRSDLYKVFLSLDGEDVPFDRYVFWTSNYEVSAPENGAVITLLPYGGLLGGNGSRSKKHDVLCVIRSPELSKP